MNYREFIHRSTIATLSEIINGEREFKAATGVNIADAWEREELHSIMRRIEARLARSRLQPTLGST